MSALTIAKRSPKRSRVFLSAEVDAGAGRFGVHVRDISSTGALLESDAAPQPGAEIMLICGKTQVAGHVAWSEHDWFGVEFHTPLLMSKLIDPTGAKLKVSAPRTYHSGVLPD